MSNNIQLAAFWGSRAQFYAVPMMHLSIKICVTNMGFPGGSDGKQSACSRKHGHGISPLPEDTDLSPLLPLAPSPYSFTLETFSGHPHPQAEGGEP